MFVDWLAASEAKWILDDEQFWRPPNRLTVDPDTMQLLTDAEADASTPG
jgi:hypothetical protein